MTPDPLPHDQLLVFAVQLLVLLAAARGAGVVARRFGQPAVLGELGAGLLLGPSVLGAAVPRVAAELFPPGIVQDGLLMAVAWLGVVFLLVTTGYETDLRLVATRLRASVLVPVGSLIVPLAAGFAVGLAAPRSFRGDNADALTLALFLAVALALSALPVVARILQDMRVMRRTFAQVIVVAAMADDVVGWLLLGLLTGAVTGRGLALTELAVTVAAVLAFLAFAFTWGQRAVDRALRASFDAGSSVSGAFTVSLLVVFACAIVTQWLGVEAVVGAFIAGLLLGRSRYRSARVQEILETVSTGFLAPIFFATAGLSVDLRLLADPTTAVWTVLLLVAAVASKIGGSYIGGRLTGLPSDQSLMLGVGLNARGALGIVAASIALNVGVFSERSYTAVVLMAVATSMLVPPLLRPLLARQQEDEVESQRLAREHLLHHSVIANVQHVLVPTRGGHNSAAAARVVDLIMPRDATVTVLHTRDPQQPAAAPFDTVVAQLSARHVDRRQVVGDPADAILRELRYGYGLVALGVTEDVRAPARLSPTLERVLTATTAPVLLVRSPSGAALDGPVVVPSTGTRAGRAAEEIAYSLAARTDADVEIVHVVGRPDRMVLSAWSGQRDEHRGAEGVLSRSVDLAGRFGRSARATLRTGSTPHEGLLDVARERRAEIVVASGTIRAHGGGIFLGHGTEYLLEHVTATLILILFPDSIAGAIDGRGLSRVRAGA